MDRGPNQIQLLMAMIVLALLSGKKVVQSDLKGDEVSGSYW